MSHFPHPRACHELTALTGIGGKPEQLVNTDLTSADGIPLLKRYSGGGTVIVSDSVLFVSFIMGPLIEPSVPPYPRSIMDWSGGFYRDGASSPAMITDSPPAQSSPPAAHPDLRSLSGRTTTCSVTSSLAATRRPSVASGGPGHARGPRSPDPPDGCTTPPCSGGSTPCSCATSPCRPRHRSTGTGRGPLTSLPCAGVVTGP